MVDSKSTSLVDSSADPESLSETTSPVVDLSAKNVIEYVPLIEYLPTLLSQH